eukprot:CAMPEP_0115047890 /NCGR_PEP_ID=MMETSP0227-20121206/232_1 /TAXON_ID=89957 /ORGANISM="Polarella glacialis, Strain CCMP 1383" /LENGTH=60 /DNA_ID=CAMNT_0002431189 /DNA_START=401 /DNA_END=583 /DNA_ORIENTATION=-
MQVSDPEQAPNSVRKAAPPNFVTSSCRFVTAVVANLSQTSQSEEAGSPLLSQAAKANPQE